VKFLPTFNVDVVSSIELFTNEPDAESYLGTNLSESVQGAVALIVHDLLAERSNVVPLMVMVLVLGTDEFHCVLLPPLAVIVPE
jgi:hypothetical protein